MPDRTTFTAVFTLSLIHAFGINSMYGLIYRNGYIKSLMDLWTYGPYVLPGTNIPILTRFTGIWPMDKALTLAGVMFSNVTDGTTPQLSLYGFQFAGQLVPIFTVMAIEGLRLRNRGGVFSMSALWGCAMQGLGYGFIMPIYSIVHLLSSPAASNIDTATAQTIRLSSSGLLRTLPQAVILGYIVPSILMAVPIPFPILHQWFGGFWQGFPVWVVLSQYALNYFQNAPATDATTEAHSCSKSKSHSSYQSERIAENKALNRAYLFAFRFSVVTQLITYDTLATCKVFPELFAPATQATLTFSNVFIPPSFYSVVPMQSAAVGVMNFWQYDQITGAAAGIVWAATLWVKSQKQLRRQRIAVKEWWRLGGEILGTFIIGGPGATLVWLIWKRDETIFMMINC